MDDWSVHKWIAIKSKTELAPATSEALAQLGSRALETGTNVITLGTNTLTLALEDRQSPMKTTVVAKGGLLL